MNRRLLYKMDTMDTWYELRFKPDSVTSISPPKLINGLWSKLVRTLGEIKDINIACPKDEAWFHIRRAPNRNSDEIDVLRLKKESLSSEYKEKIRLIAEGCKGITSANWYSWPPEPRHDDAFLSFLQKLSILRTRDGICYNKYLGKVSNHYYDKCPYCQEAYNVMKTTNSQWYIPLTPWFDHMSATKMDNYRTHEYAHWFGHILSGTLNC